MLDVTRTVVPRKEDPGPGPGTVPDRGRSDADRGSRPKDARELAASAINLALANYRVLICATAVVLVPTFVVGGTALGYWREKSATSLNSTGGARTAELIGLAVFVFGGLLAQAAGVHAATNLAAGRTADWHRSVSVAFSRTGPVVAAGITVAVLSGLGLICFIVPGVYLWFSWLVVMPVVVLERRAGREALTRASYLVRGRWWSVFGGFVLVELFIVLWTVVATVIVAVVVHVSSTNEAVAEQLASAFVELALAPIIVSFVSVTYLDLRLRKEGFSPANVASESDYVSDGGFVDAARPGGWWGPGQNPGLPPWQRPVAPPPPPPEGSWWPVEAPREAPSGYASPGKAARLAGRLAEASTSRTARGYAGRRVVGKLDRAAGGRFRRTGGDVMAARLISLHALPRPSGHRVISSRA